MKFWARTSKFDVFDNLTGAVVSRNISAAEAAVALGKTEQEIMDGVANYSFVDGNDLRCTGHGQISGSPL
jgi:hypothetical protein